MYLSENVSHAHLLAVPRGENLSPFPQSVLDMSSYAIVEKCRMLGDTYEVCLCQLNSTQLKCRTLFYQTPRDSDQ